MNRNKAKGTAAESAVVKVLRVSGFPHAERAPLSGGVDKGDITGTPGLAWEVRARKEVCLPQWLRDAASRKAARGADFGILVVKPEGMGAAVVGEWACVLPLHQMAELLTQAGYGSPALLTREGNVSGLSDAHGA